MVIRALIGNIADSFGGSPAGPFSGNTSLATSIENYYKYDGGATDSVGSNDGTVSGALNSSSYGKINEGYFFDGTNDAISANSPPDIGTGDMSINCWFYDAATKASSEKLFWFGSSSTRASVGPFIDNGVLKIGMYGVGLSTSTSYTAGQWNMCTIVLSGGNDVKLYLNGSPIGSDSETYDLGTDYFWVGDDTFSAWFNGNIDEVGVWSKALSNQNALDLWNSGNGLQY